MKKHKPSEETLELLFQKHPISWDEPMIGIVKNKADAKKVAEQEEQKRPGWLVSWETFPVPASTNLTDGDSVYLVVDILNAEFSAQYDDPRGITLTLDDAQHLAQAYKESQGSESRIIKMKLGNIDTSMWDEYVPESDGRTGMSLE